MTPQKLVRKLVPLIPKETEHQWMHAKMYGCETCGWHDGFQCRTCGRCVDWELDTPLYEAIAALGDWPWEGGKPWQLRQSPE